MPARDLVLKLARLVAAAAWADDVLKEEEINALKDLLFATLPELTGDEWRHLEIYLDSPVAGRERERLLTDVLEAVAGAEDKRLVADTLEALAEADGEVSGEERELLESVERRLEERDTGLLARLGRLLGGAVGRRREAARRGPNREQRIEDYVRNAVYYQLVDELRAENFKLDLPEEQVRKLCLAAGLMARVAAADENIADEERQAMVRILNQTWRLSEPEARLVVRASLSRTLRGLDRFQLNRGFFEATTLEERRDFLKVLFQVANAADKTSNVEIEEIRDIAGSLRLDHPDFIAAKLSISPEDRAGL